MWIHYLTKNKELKYFKGKKNRITCTFAGTFQLKHPYTNAHTHKREIFILIPQGSIPSRGSLQRQGSLSAWFWYILCPQAELRLKIGCGDARVLLESAWALASLWILPTMKVWCGPKSRGSRVTKALIWILSFNNYMTLSKMKTQFPNL